MIIDGRKEVKGLDVRFVPDVAQGPWETPIWWCYVMEDNDRFGLIELRETKKKYARKTTRTYNFKTVSHRSIETKYLYEVVEFMWHLEKGDL